MEIDPPLSQLSSLRTPRLADPVHREECTQCFISQDSPSGIYVCLHCFNGSCIVNNHLALHAQKTKHIFYLHISRKRKAKEERGEPPAKITKLAIVEEREEDLYEWTTTLGFWSGSAFKSIENEAGVDKGQIKELTEGVMTSMSSGRQNDIKAWEEELEGCEHGFLVQPEGGKKIDAQGTAHCSQCELTNNLWLCLTCGNLGCGRKQYGGVPGGNGHGIEHFESTHHHMSVKLGTITPEGGADVHCYTCDDSRLLPQLKDHLAVWGINVNVLSKTEKSLSELQIEHNLKYDFSMSTEDGKDEPVFGPSLTGLRNLGNSCYLASTLQVLFYLDQWRESFRMDIIKSHWEQCPEIRSAECFQCQMSKIAHGLMSGDFSVSSSLSAEKWQDGVRPSGFKALIGKGHPEFGTMKQQDAEEFLVWLLETFRRDLFKRKASEDQDPTTTFSFGFEQRLQCTTCKKVRYSTEETDTLSLAIDAIESGTTPDGKTLYAPVSLLSAIHSVINGTSGGESLPSYRCPSCAKSVIAQKSTLFATFPETLVIHAKKFKVVGWVPQKLEIPLEVPDTLTFEKEDLGLGLKEGEVELPAEEEIEDDEPEPTFNELALTQIQTMGFSELRAKKALLATGNGDNVEAAMEWLFVHIEDPDLDSPIQVGKKSRPGGTGKAEATEDQISMVLDMGFSRGMAKRALGECDNNIERAVEWLFSHPDEDEEPSSSTTAATTPTKNTIKGTKTAPVSYQLLAFISHKGPSVHSGHYVAHVKHPELGWVLFNDEKVGKVSVESVADLKKDAYVYFWTRV